MSSTNCPKCSHPRKPAEAMCSGCGIYFAKWEDSQRRKAEVATASLPESGSNATVIAELDDWIRHKARWASILLVVGFFLPLLKHSMLANKSFMVWPWHLAGLSKDPGITMALSTYSEGAYPGSWTLLPLVTVCFVYFAGRMARSSLKMQAYAITGLSSLTLLLAVFIQENERLGLVFTPPTLGAGIVSTVAIAAGSLIAAANHASRMQPDAIKPARWAGIGGIVLTCVVLLYMLGGDGPWKAWPMWGLYGLVLIYAVLAATRLFGDVPEMTSIGRLSVIVRLVIAWCVVAIILAQITDQDGYSIYVIQGGGSTISTALAAVKGFFIFFGSALIFAFGIAGWLAKESGE